MNPLLVPSDLDVVILCGGRGTRLGALSATTPKPLLPIAGRPFLLHLLMRLQGEGFTRVILAAHYLAEQFRAFIQAQQSLMPEMELLVEPRPLGTGGALRYAAESVRSSTFVALNGDSWIAQPLAPVLEDHTQHARVFTGVVIPAAQVTGGASAKGVWRIGADRTVQGFITQEQATNDWVNAGLYLLDRAFVRSWPLGAYSLEQHFATLLRGKAAGVFYSAERLLDIGTPACYESANRILASADASLAAFRE